MTRNDYLGKLREYLYGMPQDEVNDILYDYEEHFQLGIQDGKTEDEISASLGDVKMVAKMFKADFTIERATVNASAGNVLKAILAAMGLSFFNLVFVLGPFCGAVGVLIGLFGASLGITLGGVAAIVASQLQSLFPEYIDFGGVDQIFIFAVSVGMTCLGLLFTMGNIWISKWFYRLTLKYLKWNIAVIKK